MKKFFKTSTGKKIEYDTDTQYLDSITISNKNVQIGDILLLHDAVFEVINRHESQHEQKTHGDNNLVWWHDTKRIDSKPWDLYFSDILKDGFSFQGNERATTAKFKEVKNKRFI